MIRRRRIYTEALGMPVVVTTHFQDRWDERVDARMVLPLARIVQTFAEFEDGEYRTRIPAPPVQPPCVILSRQPEGIHLLTVIVGPYRGSLGWTPLREAA